MRSGIRRRCNALGGDSFSKDITDGADTLYANASLVSITAASQGPRTVRFPNAASVADLASGDSLGVKTLSVSLDMQTGETRLLRYSAEP
jgi:hypothetical protein